METNKQHNRARARQLGEFMYEISSGVRLASPAAILRYEIDKALAKAFQRPLSIRPFTLLGTSVGHVLDKRNSGLQIHDPSDVFDADTKLALVIQANAILEKALLTGDTPWGPTPRVRPDYSHVEDEFVEHLYEFRKRLSSADRDTASRALYATVLVDILEPVKVAMLYHGISIDDFARLGLNGWIDFLEDMPSVNVNLGLRRHWLQNPELKAKRSDQNDWYYLGAAVAYCDVVVTERHFAHVVNCGSLRKRGSVITSLLRLPGA